MVKFLFDLDGTVTKQETLPIISANFNIQHEIDALTMETVKGNIPFIESFIRRVYILGKLPINEVSSLLEKVELFERVVDFIKANPSNCAIVTGNLGCWVDKLCKKIGCEYYTSHGVIEDNKVIKLKSIIRKENVVERFKAEGYRVVFIGDGNNDVEAMRSADVSIASGLIHSPAAGVMSVADYLVLSEESLCRQLNQLL